MKKKTHERERHKNTCRDEMFFNKWRAERKRRKTAEIFIKQKKKKKKINNVYTQTKQRYVYEQEKTKNIDQQKRNNREIVYV